MKSFSLFVIFVAHFINSLTEARVASSTCNWNLKNEIPEDNAPIYLSRNRLIIPNNGELQANYSQEITFLCPGRKNNVLGSDDKELSVTCAGGNNVRFQDENVPLKAFVCTENLAPTLVSNRTDCAKGEGENMAIGFGTSKQFVSLLEVCYDKSLQRAIYSKNIIYGKTIKSSQKSKVRPSLFRTEKLTSGVPYTKKELEKTFTRILGASQARKYLNGDSTISRGHLAPDADYVLDSWVTVTYSLTNVAPEWQAVNVGNWLRVEKFARDVANDRQEDLVALTGTHQILELPDGNGNMKEIFLGPGKKIPMPKWFWKIVYSPKKSEGIAFVTLNNPHKDYLTNGEFLCDDICNSYGWYKAEFKSYEKGYTYCCEVGQFLNSVKFVDKINVKRIMRGPK